MLKDRAARNQDSRECESDSVNPTPTQVAVECGKYGLTVFEAESYLNKRLTDTQLMEAYYRGKSEHAFTIMRAIYKRGVEQGDAKLLMWLAENSLKRTVQAEAEDSVFAAMSPEQRQEEIRRLTKQIELRKNG
jgi:thioredoxin-like negative regulator of GroEL